jgi:predicted metal-dependent hydrolase
MKIEINQIVRSKRKTLALIVKGDGSLIVRAPMRTSDKAIQEFVAEHRSWIERKQAEIKSIAILQPRQYVPGERFMFLGHLFPLEIVEEQQQPLILNGSFKLAEADSERAGSIFEDWYRERAREIINERVGTYASGYGFQYQGIKITSAKTRWGSCSSKGSLNFSWRLILAPLEQVDYVVVHELVHTVIHNHSKRFWNKVEKILPDFKERKKWLRKYGVQLTL